LDVELGWPWFCGDSEKFHAWYLPVMAQISLPPWQELYDPKKKNIVTMIWQTLW
jgi:hypothetical protein